MEPPESNAPVSDRRPVALDPLLIAVFIAYLSLRFAFLWSHQPAEFPDTETYTGNYRGSRVECDNSFWTGIRPPTVPWIFRLFNNDFDRIALFQTLLSSVAWGILSCAVGRRIQSRVLRLAGVAAVLLFGLNPNILYWDTAMLSESLALSLHALLLGIVFWMLAGWRGWKFAAFALIAGLWVFVRDTHAWYLLILTPFLAFAPSIGMSRRCAQSLMVLIVGLFAISNHLSTRSLRWAGPFMNVLTKRILIRPEYLDFFEKRGLPVSEDLMRTAGQPHPIEMHTAGKYEPQRAWIFEKGKRTYSLFLLAHPGFFWLEPLEDLRSSLAQRWLAKGEFDDLGYVPPVPDLVSEVLYGERFNYFRVYLAALVAGLSLLTGFQSKRSDLLIVAALILTSLPHALIGWHGDAIEMKRHTLLAAVQLRIGALLGLFILADVSLGRWRRPARTPAPSE